MRYFVEFSYNGSKYHGYKKLTKMLTVFNRQLIKCLSILLQTEIDLVGTGRTDSGVHVCKCLHILIINFLLISEDCL